MAKLIDSHVHTHYSHGDAEVFEMVMDAIARGVQNIGFAEHYLRCDDTKMPILRSGIFFREDRDFYHYLNATVRAKSFFKDKIDIRTGAEVDYLSGNDADIREGLKDLDLDYLMGSVHFVGEPCMYVREHEYLEGDNLVHTYFAETKKLIKTGLFDILSHPELVRYDVEYDVKKFESDFKEITDLLKKYNMAVEINTSYVDVTSEKSIIDTLNPGTYWLKMCIDAELPFVIGSDAHRPGEIALNFEKMFPVLKKLGIKKLAYYVKRKPVFYEI